MPRGRQSGRRSNPSGSALSVSIPNHPQPDWRMADRIVLIGLGGGDFETSSLLSAPNRITDIDFQRPSGARITQSSKNPAQKSRF